MIKEYLICRGQAGPTNFALIEQRMLSDKTLKSIKNNERDIKKEDPGLEKKYLQKHLCRWPGSYPASWYLGLGSSFLMGDILLGFKKKEGS